MTALWLCLRKNMDHGYLPKPSFPWDAVVFTWPGRTGGGRADMGVEQWPLKPNQLALLPGRDILTGILRAAASSKSSPETGEQEREK